MNELRAEKRSLDRFVANSKSRENLLAAALKEAELAAAGSGSPIGKGPMAAWASPTQKGVSGSSSTPFLRRQDDKAGNAQRVREKKAMSALPPMASPPRPTKRVSLTLERSGGGQGATGSGGKWETQGFDVGRLSPPPLGSPSVGAGAFPHALLTG